ncbi:hypothetical protein Hanom_Chr00s000001g01595251 [Helianthus anomalus]
MFFCCNWIKDLAPYVSFDCIGAIILIYLRFYLNLIFVTATILLSDDEDSMECYKFNKLIIEKNSIIIL